MSATKLRRFALYGIPELGLRTWVEEGALHPEPVVVDGERHVWWMLAFVEELPHAKG
jgi:hypothetical protein